MKVKYIILLILLFIKIQTVKPKSSNNIGKKLRFLLDNTINYDSSLREGADKESVENCKNIDYKYFINYISGYDITFDKNISIDGAVRINYY